MFVYRTLYQSPMGKVKRNPHTKQPVPIPYQSPMGKVKKKLSETDFNCLNWYLVSIPYGKGKVKKMRKKTKFKKVSIPYGKGKVGGQNGSILHQSENDEEEN